MDGPTHLVVFCLDERRFALPLSAVDRIVRAVEVTPLPEAPELVMGIINLQGQVVSVINTRRRCGLPERDMEPTDQLVIAHAPTRKVALAVDYAEVIECGAGGLVPAGDILPAEEFIRQVVKRDDGLILVCDLETLLSNEEERTLHGAIGAGGAVP